MGVKATGTAPIRDLRSTQPTLTSPSTCHCHPKPQVRPRTSTPLGGARLGHWRPTLDPLCNGTSGVQPPDPLTLQKGGSGSQRFMSKRIQRDASVSPAQVSLSAGRGQWDAPPCPTPKGIRNGGGGDCTGGVGGVFWGGFAPPPQWTALQGHPLLKPT
mmetsp:Transcript_38131/g.68098  ORF Transcript_38131/g.68098 Transcript_38131/m.68098 type:complete len:158 (-) Transcript_38131:71-544(-)